MKGTVSIFFLYAEADSEVLNKLRLHLDALKKPWKVSFWNDDPISPQKEWYPQNISRFEEADIYLFLISNAFLQSKFIEQIEFKKVIDRYKDGKAKVMPLVLDECPWDANFESDEYDFSFKELKMLPEMDKPMYKWESTDKAFQKCMPHIEAVIAQLNESKFNLVHDAKPKRWIGNDRLERRISGSENSDGGTTESVIQGVKPRKEVETKIQHKEEVLIGREEKVKMSAPASEDSVENSEAASSLTVINKEQASNFEEPVRPKDKNTLKTVLSVTALLLLIGAGIVFFSAKDAQEPQNIAPQIINQKVPPKQVDLDQVEIPTGQTVNATIEFPEIKVGDTQGQGIVFQIEEEGKTGKIVHSEDLGPMIWTDAMKIHEELGEGWRLPTLDELRTIYKTVGQGADNSGQFADKLYWSATPYDENQARLLRFRDGNTSYHYNSRGTHRKFLVRAIRDYGQ